MVADITEEREVIDEERVRFRIHEIHLSYPSVLLMWIRRTILTDMLSSGKYDSCACIIVIV